MESLKKEILWNNKVSINSKICKTRENIELKSLEDEVNEIMENQKKKSNSLRKKQLNEQENFEAQNQIKYKNSIQLKNFTNLLTFPFSNGCQNGEIILVNTMNELYKIAECREVLLP